MKLKLWILIGLLGLLFVMAWSRTDNNPPSPTTPLQTIAIDKSEKMQASRKKLMQEMIKERHFFTKIIRNGNTMPRVWATPTFLSLTFDQKQSFLGVIYAYYLTGTVDDSVAIIDTITGKEIGRFSANGLRLD
jgi:hypothetical protein